MRKFDNIRNGMNGSFDDIDLVPKNLRFDNLGDENLNMSQQQDNQDINFNLDDDEDFYTARQD